MIAENTQYHKERLKSIRDLLKEGQSQEAYREFLSLIKNSTPKQIREIYRQMVALGYEDEAEFFAERSLSLNKYLLKKPLPNALDCILEEE